MEKANAQMGLKNFCGRAFDAYRAQSGFSPIRWYCEGIVDALREYAKECPVEQWTDAEKEYLEEVYGIWKENLKDVIDGTAPRSYTKLWNIDAETLVNLCVKNQILAEQDGGIFIYREAGECMGEGWYLEPKELVASELRDDPEGINMMIGELAKKGVAFSPKMSLSFQVLPLDKFLGRTTEAES